MTLWVNVKLESGRVEFLTNIRNAKGMGPRYGHVLLVRGYPVLVLPLVQSMESNVNLKM